MGNFDPKSFALPSTRTKPTKVHTTLPTFRKGEHFLKGPIPLSWLKAAFRLPGKSPHVGIVIWYRAGLEKSGTIRLGNGVLEQFGIKPDAKRRALLHLEKAGLIRVQREPNKNPLVTLLSMGADHG